MREDALVTLLACLSLGFASSEFLLEHLLWPVHTWRTGNGQEIDEEEFHISEYSKTQSWPLLGVS